jgi:hypothetical protein
MGGYLKWYYLIKPRENSRELGNPISAVPPILFEDHLAA